MNWRRKVRDLKRSARWAWHSMGPRRIPIAAVSGALVLILALGAWSCQTTPARPRTPIPSAARSTTPLTAEPEMRVRIRQGIETVRIEGPSPLSVRSLAGGAEPRTLPSPLTATILDDGMRITDGRGAHWGYQGGVEVWSAAPEARLRIDNQSFAGRLRIMLREAAPARSGSTAASGSPARLDVIEFIPMEMYIAGVTVSELLPQWSLGAFHVQSVAARTYALQQRQRSQGMGRDFDIESTVIDQAYNGWTNHAFARQAAAETRGMVLTWQGRLLRAYYSSTCGGRPAGAAEVWPTGPGFEFNLDGPIQSTQREHTCESSRFYRWEVVRDRDELSTRFREWAKTSGHALRSVGQVRSVAVAESNSTGRPVRYTVTDDKGRRFDIGAEHLRNACNLNVAGLPEIKGVAPLRVLSGDLEMNFSGARVTIRGRGFGHGVGMCQYCAEGMAKRGDDWREVLGRFYPGARVERMY
jgi:stage II sporulation protein D